MTAGGYLTVRDIMSRLRVSRSSANRIAHACLHYRVDGELQVPARSFWQYLCERAVLPAPHVYFIQAQVTGLLKIGTAGDSLQRLAELRTMSPDRLRLLGVVAGGHRDERDLHRRFRELRAHGEWFWPGRPLLDYLEEHATPWIEGLGWAPRELREWLA